MASMLPHDGMQNGSNGTGRQALRGKQPKKLLVRERKPGHGVGVIDGERRKPQQLGSLHALGGWANGPQERPRCTPGPCGELGQPTFIPECQGSGEHGIAREELVATESGQGHGDARLPGHLAHHPGVGAIATRMVHGGQGVREHPEEFSRAQPNGGVISPEAF